MSDPAETASLAAASVGTAPLGAALPRLLGVLRSRSRIGAVAHVIGIRVVALGGNICSGLLTAALLGPAGRGEQTAVCVAPLLLGSICSLGLHASLIYNLRLDSRHSSRYFGTAIILTSAVGLLAMLAGFVMMPSWLKHYDASIIAFARLLLISVPLAVVSPLLMGVLEANGRFRTANRTLYFQSLGALGLLVVLASAGWLTPLSAAAAYLAPSVPSFIYLFVQARRVVRPNLTISAPYPYRLLRYGLRFYGVDILAVLSGYLDQVVIVYLLQPAAVGAYAVALSLSRVLNVAQGAISTVLFPSIAAGQTASVIDTVARAMRITTMLNVLGATVIGLIGPWLLILLYGHRFAAAVLPFQVLLGEAVVSSAARILAQAFSGTGHPAAVTAVEVAGVAASLAAMLVLVPSYGIVGAAYGALIGGFVRLLAVLTSFRRVLGTGLPRLVIGRADFTSMAGR